MTFAAQPAGAVEMGLHLPLLLSTLSELREGVRDRLAQGVWNDRSAQCEEQHLQLGLREKVRRCVLGGARR